MKLFYRCHFLFLIVLSVAISLISMASGHAQNRTMSSVGVTNSIANLLEGDTDIALPVRQRRAAFLKYYVEDQGALLWIGTERMQAFIELLERAGFDGLDPRAYPIKSLQKLLQKASGSDAVGLAKIELMYSAFFIRYASDVKIGRFLPGKIDPKLY